jgi:hypothetical protein
MTLAIIPCAAMNSADITSILCIIGLKNLFQDIRMKASNFIRWKRERLSQLIEERVSPWNDSIVTIRPFNFESNDTIGDHLWSEQKDLGFDELEIGALADVKEFGF